MKFVSALVAIAALASSVSAVLSTCGKDSDAFQLTTATYSPNPATVGKEVCIILKGVTKAEIAAGAQLTVTTTINGFPFKVPVDLCKTLASTVKCPIPEGDIEIEKCDIVPNGVPTDKPLEVTVEATTAEGLPIFCLKGSFNFQT